MAITIIEDKLSPGLARIHGAAGDLTRPMALISEAMLDHTHDRFDHEYSPLGVPWEPSQRVLKEGGRTLFESGALRNALDRDSGADFAQVGVIATGGPAIYARILNDGGIITPRGDRGDGKPAAKALKTPFGPRASVTIPARPFLGIEERDRTSAEEILLAHLEEAA